jgi:hypothetical protein
LASNSTPTHANGPLLGLSADLQEQYQLETLLKAADEDQGVFLPADHWREG